MIDANCSCNGMNVVQKEFKRSFLIGVNHVLILHAFFDLHFFNSFLALGLALRMLPLFPLGLLQLFRLDHHLI